MAVNIEMQPSKPWALAFPFFRESELAAARQGVTVLAALSIEYIFGQLLLALAGRDHSIQLLVGRRSGF